MDVSEWETKGLAHLVPSSASSRASYASLSSQASRSSYSSYLSIASRTTLTEMEKEEEAREAADKARLREIDARLRELSSADAGNAGGDAQVVKAPAEEIRKLVRMYSSSSVPPTLA